MRDLVPAEIIDRRKMGFQFPLREWLAGPLREIARTAYESPSARALFSDGFLARSQTALRVRDKLPYQAWACLMLAAWADRHRCHL